MVATINRAQEYYYREQGKFAPDIDSLELGITSKIKHYRYHTEILSETAVQNRGISDETHTSRFWPIKKFFHNSLGLGDYVDLPLYSHTGLVRIVEDENGETIVQTALCTSIKPTSETPPTFLLPDAAIEPETETDPSNIDNDIDIPCPDGYKPH
ncbi:MAG: type IV pilin-like G/H family protein [Cyanobacteria bacterium P01_F01_bin.150]